MADGQYLTRQVNLIGVDEETYAEVGDFGQYLLHPENRQQLSFQLREDGYAPERPKFPASGWNYRRQRLRYEQALEEEQALVRAKEAMQAGIPLDPTAANATSPPIRYGSAIAAAPTPTAAGRSTDAAAVVRSDASSIRPASSWASPSAASG